MIDYILLQIETEAWPIGFRLPAERILSSQIKVSRATVREGILSLRVSGYIKTIQGSGSFVTQLSDDFRNPLAFESEESFDHFELREYRYAIEAQCAYLAANRATKVQLRKLEKAHEHLRFVHLKNDLKAEGLADARFHLAIAEASGNRILAYSLKSLFSLLKANVIANIGGLAKRPETRLRLMKQHTQLFESIYYQKPLKARKLAQEHMDFVNRIINEKY